jgi:hypothetical protein
MPGMRATRVSSTYQVGQALLRNWRCLGCRFPGEKQLFDYETRIRLQRKWVNQVLSSLAGRRYSKHRQSNSGSRVSLTACLLKSRRRSQRRCESGNKVVIHAATCDLAAPQSAIPSSSASSLGPQLQNSPPLVRERCIVFSTSLVPSLQGNRCIISTPVSA